MKKNYTCIFFDLDHTLWDFESNSSDTLTELYQSHSLIDVGIPDVQDLLMAFKQVNARLWDLHDRGLMDSETLRNERFKLILESFHAYDRELSENLSRDYLATCPKKSKLMPHALETLSYLQGKYALTLITNGFEDVQRTKLNSGNLFSYFDHIVISQQTGYKKPAPEIFEVALKANTIGPEGAVMVGDNLLTDIAGARNARIDAAYYNPEGVAHQEKIEYEIKNLKELCAFL